MLVMLSNLNPNRLMLDRKDIRNLAILRIKGVIVLSLFLPRVVPIHPVHKKIPEKIH